MAAAIKMLLRKRETERQRDIEIETNATQSEYCERETVMALHLAMCVHAIDAGVIFCYYTSHFSPI